MSRLLGNAHIIAAISLVTSVLAACTATKREYPATDAGPGASVCKPACGGATPLCDESKKECVQCLVNDTCTDPAVPACVSGDCSACTMDSQCSHIIGKGICKTLNSMDAGTSVPDAGASLGTCVQCVMNSECTSSSKPVCDESTNDCVQCVQSNDCLDAKTAVCSNNTCTACQFDTDCAHITGKGYCGSGECVKPPVKAITAGNYHTCGLYTDGSVRCWGSNKAGQLGNGSTTNSPTPVQVSSITTATLVSAGTDHTCAIIKGGTIQCWGANSSGQLGNGSTTSSPTPLPVSGITTATALAVGGSHTCAVFADGTIQCWGANSYGQVGNNATLGSSTPVEASGITTAKTVTAGVGHTCAILAAGTVQCWGTNVVGQLGNTITNGSKVPVDVSGLTQVTAVAAGGAHTCAVRASGAVSCWGSNIDGELGNGGTASSSSAPLAIAGLGQVTAIAAGGDFSFSDFVTVTSPHSCALLNGGTIQCWGDNSFGQFGNGTTSGGSRTAVLGVSQAIAIATGFRHVCALFNGGTMLCWGDNSYGQLGTGDLTGSLVPVTVLGL